MNPMRCVRMLAISAPPAPTKPAIADMTTTRRSTGAYCGGASTDANAGSSDGATGKPSAALRGIDSPSDTLRMSLRLVFSHHRWRGQVDLCHVKPALQQVGER